MPLAWKPARLPKPHTQIQTRRGTLRFYLGDCLEVLRSLTPGTISVIVTSPPYNLGVRYRSYDDTLPRERYLDWTGAWIKAAAKALDPAGSLFLNVGAKPTDPWTALDVAQAARPHLQLQNTIHWIKSIAIDRDAAGAGAGLTRDLNVGHYKPINSARFVNDCQEFIFHFTPGGRTPLDRRAIGVKYQDASNVARWGGGAERSALPRQHLVHSLRDDPEPRQGPPPPGHLPAAHARVLRAPARRRSNEGPARSLPRARQLGACGRGPWDRFRRRGDRQALSGGSRIARQSFALGPASASAASSFRLPASGFRRLPRPAGRLSSCRLADEKSPVLLNATPGFRITERRLEPDARAELNLPARTEVVAQEPREVRRRQRW